MSNERGSQLGSRSAGLVWAATLLFVLAARAEPQDYPVERQRSTVGADGIAGVESGRVSAAGELHLGLRVGAASNPLTLRDAAQGTILGALVADRVGGAVVASYGLWGRATIGLELPFVAYQGRESGILPERTSTSLPALAAGGPGDLRVVPKVSLLDAARGDRFDLAALLPVTAPTGGSDAYRGEAGWTVAPELAASLSSGRWRGAVNVATMIRPSRRVINLEAGSEWLLSMAGSYRCFDAPTEAHPLSLSAALLGGTSLSAPFSNVNASPLEVRAEASYGLAREFDVVLGGGLGLSGAWGVPARRLYASVLYTPKPPLPPPPPVAPPPPPDRDHDEIVDLIDHCPDQPEDVDGFEDLDGCPEPDNDDDGVPDAADQCPNAREDRDGFTDEDGCPDPDNDHDGVVDAADQCPSEPEDKDGFQDDDGCADPDNDGDGVLDPDESAPECVGAPEDKDGFEDDDGCPDPDNDRDGIPDEGDRCPLEAGVPEQQGCPDPDRDGDGVVDRLDTCLEEAGTAEQRGCAKKPFVALAAGRIELLVPIEFEAGKHSLDRRSAPVLDQLAQVLAARPAWSIRVELHSDELKTPEKNLDLTQRRGEVLKARLGARSVAPERIETVARGDAQPLAPKGSKEARTQNRRLEITVVSQEGR